MSAALLAALLALQSGELPAWRTLQEARLPKAGPIKIVLPAATLDAARPGLEDLRILDETGREIPWSAELPRGESLSARRAASWKVTLEKDSTVVLVETGLAQPVGGVEIETPAGTFVKAMDVEGSTDGIAWVPLVRNEALWLGPGSGRKLDAELPPKAWPRLRLVLDDRKTPAVPVTGVRVKPALAEEAPSEAFDPAVLERLEEPGRTHLRLLFPGRHAALAALSIETSEPLFRRRIRLSARVAKGSGVALRTLAEAVLFRIQVEGSPPASRLSLGGDAVLPERELLLTIENDGSPPLAITAIKARRRVVHLAMSAAQAGTARFFTGNPDCAAPRYDLPAPGVLKSVDALDLSAPRANPAYRAPELLPGLGGLGAPLDPAPWQRRRAVALKPGPVHQLELDLEVLLRSPGLADLRLLRDGRQLPYLLERTELSRPMDLVLESRPDPVRKGMSRWRIALPGGGLPGGSMTFEAVEAVFRREARLVVGERDSRGERFARTVAAATWVRRPGDAAGPLVLGGFGPIAAPEVWLEVDDGDNASLAVKGARAWLPVIRMLFKAGEGSPVSLHYGNPRAAPPDYDLELAAPQLLAAEKAEAALGAVEGAPAPAAQEPGEAGWIFWAVLAGVVAVLIVVIVRLLPAAPPPA